MTDTSRIDRQIASGVTNGYRDTMIALSRKIAKQKIRDLDTYVTASIDAIIEETILAEIKSQTYRAVQQYMNDIIDKASARIRTLIQAELSRMLDDKEFWDND